MCFLERGEEAGASDPASTQASTHHKLRRILIFFFGVHGVSQCMWDIVLSRADGFAGSGRRREDAVAFVTSTLDKVIAKLAIHVFPRCISDFA